MKTKLRISTLIVGISILFTSTISLTNLANAIAVGPDAFGYFSIDSGTNGGPSYQFEDISGTGTQLTFFDAGNLSSANADDGVAINIPLTILNSGAGFPFYGNSYTEVHMSTNGLLTFTLTSNSDTLTNTCPAQSAAEPNNAIYVLWDDLDLRGATAGGFTQSFNNCPLTSGGTSACVIFQWNNADHFGGGADSFDFQVALYENGNILMNYAPGNPETGSGSTTGIENSTASISLTNVCNSAGSIPPSSSMLFTPIPPTISLSATVELDSGVESCGINESLSVLPGQTVRYCHKILNTGFLPIVSHDLVDDNLGTILNSFPYLLNPGSSAFITSTYLVNSSTTSSSTWTGHSPYGPNAFSSDSVTVIVDSDGDGVPEEGDLCPTDPNKIAAGQCGCGVSDADTDGDAFLNCVEACDFDAKKTNPGICGCGVQDLDQNANGITDCFSTSDLKTELNKLLGLVGKLGANKKATKPKTVKTALIAVLAQINGNSSNLQITSGADISALSVNLEKTVKKATKINAVDFKKNKLKAKKAINGIIAILIG